MTRVVIWKYVCRSLQICLPQVAEDFSSALDDAREHKDFILASEMEGPDADRLIQNIVERAEGVFLWVRLVVDSLLEGLTAGVSIFEL